LAIILIRTIIVYCTITVALRLMGKRQMGELELNELVVAILISDLAANPLQDIGIPLLNVLLPIVVLLCCELLISGLIMKSIRARTVICGTPQQSWWRKNGVIAQREMRPQPLYHRRAGGGAAHPGHQRHQHHPIRRAGTDGSLNVMLFPAHQPRWTAGQMGLHVSNPGYATILINDGKLLNKNLARTGHDRKWSAR
jgi:uncharacterized membrane protein YcaP (DUF421 family)